MIGAALGYNDLTVIIAVFDSQETAEQKLVEWGAEWKQFPIFEKGKETDKLGKPQLCTTGRFADYMRDKGFDMYSTGADFTEYWNFMFLPVELNKPCSGYNDD